MAFIAIEGNDGSGKATQTKLLTEWMRASGHVVAKFSFPRYGEPAAYFVEQYLAGNYGHLPSVPYRQSSLFYALDRYDAATDIGAAVASGAVVVSDRYVGSSMAHQGGKLPTTAGRQAAYEWISELEYTALAVPKPTLNLVLLVPAELSRQLAHQRSGEVQLHESDIAQFRAAERGFREICSLWPHTFMPIECAPGGHLRSIDDIQSELRDIIGKHVKIRS